MSRISSELAGPTTYSVFRLARRVYISLTMQVAEPVMASVHSARGISTANLRGGSMRLRSRRSTVSYIVMNVFRAMMQDVQDESRHMNNLEAENGYQ